MKEVDKKINNFFEQELINNGYHIFLDNWKNSIRGFQKRFTDNKGTKYFITIYHYNFGKQYPESNAAIEDKYQATTQFRLDKSSKDICVDISYNADVLPNLWRPATSLQEIEQFYEEFFVKFNVDYYETSE